MDLKLTQWGDQESIQQRRKFKKKREEKKQNKENKEKAIHDFKEALKMGFTSPIPHVYKKAGIEFNFSKEYIQELMDFVKAEILKLKQSYYHIVHYVNPL